MDNILPWAFSLLLVSTVAHGVVETYPFENPQQEQRYHQLIDELRCPKCQNQNLSGSNSPISQDLRRRVYEMIQQGQTDQAIREHLIARYGDFITYNPPIRPLTWPLWFGPPLLLLWIGWRLRRWWQQGNRS